VIERAASWLADRAVRLGVWPGREDYRRFVVLAAYRTGSNFLLSLLRSHPSVVCFSEVFAPPKIYWGDGIHGRSGSSSALLRLRGEDPRAFLERAVFRRHRREVRAVGFKMMYTHVEKDHRYPGIGKLFDEMPGLRFIHLRRRNLLKVLVSSKVATATGAMASRDEAAARRLLEELPRIRLSVAECREHFERLWSWGESWKERLSGRETREVFYEDLSADPQGVVDGLQEFLGVPNRTVRTPLVKQGSRSPREIVENYAELEAAFAGSPWRRFFEED
jgi:LPS sulfotransferase NodH